MCRIELPKLYKISLLTIYQYSNQSVSLKYKLLIFQSAGASQMPLSVEVEAIFHQLDHLLRNEAPDSNIISYFLINF